jgi:pilus assembly protein CpaB
VLLRVSIMVPAVALLGLGSITGARMYMDREVAARIEAETRALADRALAQSNKPSSTIVVAAKAIPYGAEITRASLQEIPWPKDNALPGSFGSIQQMFEGQGRRIALASLQPNEPVLARKVTGPGQTANLAATISPNYKAISVRVDEVVGVAGFLQPGDHVDVLLSRRMNEREAISDVVAQDLRILGVDQTVEEQNSKPIVARSVTLEVHTRDAQRLIAAQSVGALTLVLRSSGDSLTEKSSSVSTTDIAPASPAVAPATAGRVSVSVFRNSARQDYSVPARLVEDRRAPIQR